jgi:hypothetical protein
MKWYISLLDIFLALMCMAGGIGFFYGLVKLAAWMAAWMVL